MKIALGVVAGMLTASLLTAPATAKTPTRAALVKQVAKLKKQVAVRDTTIGSQDVTITSLRGQVRQAAATISTLQGTNAALASQNAGLAGSLTSAVQTIAGAGNLQQLINTVLAPAQDAWPCHGDRTITIGYYASFTFSERLSDGACF